MIKLYTDKNYEGLDVVVYLTVNGDIFKYRTFVRQNNIVLVNIYFNNIYELYVDNKKINVKNIKIGE